MGGWGHRERTDGGERLGGEISNLCKKRFVRDASGGHIAERLHKLLCEIASHTRMPHCAKPIHNGCDHPATSINELATFATRGKHGRRRRRRGGARGATAGGSNQLG